jgi:hypothetical protein
MNGMGMLLKNFGIDPEQIVKDFGAVKGDIDQFKIDVLSRVQAIDAKLDSVLKYQEVTLDFLRRFEDRMLLGQPSCDTFEDAMDSASLSITRLNEMLGATIPAGPTHLHNQDNPDVVVGRLDF